MSGKILAVVTIIGYAFIAYLVSTIVHEVGHVFCGLLNKWRFFMLVVGPFKLYREDINGKIRFGLEKDITLWGGCGGTFPGKKDESNVDIFARILIAGPLASLILGAVMMIVFFMTKHELTLMIGLVAIGEGIACILPMNIKTGILYNDGSRFKRIVKHGKEREEEKALLSILITGMLEGDDAVFEEETIKTLCSSEDADYKYYGLFYAYLNAGKENNEVRMMAIKKEADELKEKASKYTLSVCVME